MRYFIQLIFALLTLAVMTWAIWQGYLLLKQEQLGLEQGTRSVLIIVSLLVLICCFMITVAIGNHADKTLRGRQFEARFALYEKFSTVWQDLLQEFTENQSVRLELRFSQLDDQLIFMASSKVLKIFFELKQIARTEGVNTPGAKETYKKLLLAMREDLGQPADFLVRKEMQNIYK